MKTYRTLADLPRYFWQKVTKTDDGCWLWTGANVRGYGQFRVDGRTTYVHRLTYMLAKDATIPAGMQIDHLCKVVECCNPDHLEMVTARENGRRSNSAPAVNARKTECRRGHQLDDENTYVDPRGYRMCRTCKRAQLLAWQARQAVAS